jgi:DNA-binding CsgD family transcriptional regulator
VLVNMLVETGGAAETEAEAICARAMTWCQSVDDLGSLAVLLVRRSILDLDTGQPDQAARHLRDAVRISGQSGNRVELANALGCGGDLAAATGRFRQAITLWAAFGALAIGELFPDLPAESRRRAEAVARARQALDPELTQAAEERGRAMNFATAVEFLLMVTDPAPGHARDGKLSTAERELVALVGQGRTDAQIAAELNMSADAVGADLGRIRDKTGAIRRSDLTRLALGTGMA